ncbi:MULTISPECIES: hypothetical protein [Clostridium]|uniref:hypothetical protein n=1 Tax=Clostridium TaxID=1485 RepID=UPI0013E975C9|nr:MULTISPECIES: hypothetical protein [Clostridium]MBW9159266.1 hypothetical protein [Clostridium tagluense]MBZ9634023.1 hypothetical protein [Clostridium sp. FP1]WLC66765.1 hypothetical protein KTC93_06130 [Clostridium tagluense]
MNISQTVLIVFSVAILLDSINLLTNTSKILVKSSIKLRTFCNSSIKGAIAKNYAKTAKILGIQGMIVGTIILILSININNPQLNRGLTSSYIVFGIALFNLFILGLVIPSVK